VLAGGEAAEEEEDEDEDDDDEEDEGGRTEDEELDDPAGGGVDPRVDGVVRDGVDRDTDFVVVVGAALDVIGVSTEEELDVDGSPKGVGGSKDPLVVPEATSESPLAEGDEDDDRLIGALAKPASSVPPDRTLDQPTVAPTMAATTAATVKPSTESRGPPCLPVPPEYDTTGEPSAFGPT
jgi:hypothetical protein